VAPEPTTSSRPAWPTRTPMTRVVTLGLRLAMVARTKASGDRPLTFGKHLPF
jgi:hypothetical protein